jgi:hypothetical protein
MDIEKKASHEAVFFIVFCLLVLSHQVNSSIELALQIPTEMNAGRQAVAVIVDI